MMLSILLEKFNTFLNYEYEHTTIFYDNIIPTGRYIEGGAIKPDILIWNKRKK